MYGAVTCASHIAFEEDDRVSLHPPEADEARVPRIPTLVRAPKRDVVHYLKPNDSSASVSTLRPDSAWPPAAMGCAPKAQGLNVKDSQHAQ